MGHCFSCFNSISESPAPCDQDPTQKKNEMNEHENKAGVKVNSDCGNLVTLEPLLGNENQRNGNKRSSTLNSINSINTATSNSNVLCYKSDYTWTTSNITLSNDANKKCSGVLHSHVTTDKSHRNFYNKMPTPLQIARCVSSELHTSDHKINALFQLYKDSNQDAILSEGIEKLCNDLQLSPDEFQVLVLAWKLNAEQMCCFTRTEFTQGLKNMKVDTITGLQNRLPEVVAELTQDSELFKDLYRFTFKFGLDVSTGQRILPVDVALVLWRLVFTICEPPILSKWLQYLEEHPHIRGIPKDTWNMFLNFCHTVGVDLSSYDDTEAWPSLFDDFVEYQNDQMNQNITKNETLKISD